MRGLDYRIFSVFADGDEVPLEKWHQMEELYSMAVPTLDINLEDFQDANALIQHVDGLESAYCPGVLAEGVVFHQVDGKTIPRLGRSTFKVISNAFLCEFD